MKSFFVALAFLTTSLTQAADFVAPKLTGPVVDEVDLLSHSETSKLEVLLRAMNEKTAAGEGIQMNVLIPKDLQGLGIDQYGIKLAEAWKLGQTKTDRGLILIVAPSERAMRLEVGYGLEGDLPDARAKQILDDTMKPFFRASRFGDGITAAIYEIAERLKLDLSSAQVDRPARQTSGRRSGGGGGGDLWKIFLFLAFFSGRVVGMKRFGSMIGGGILGGVLAMVFGFFAPLVGLLAGGVIGLILGLIFFKGGSSAGGTFFGGGGGLGGGGGFGGGGGSWGGGGGGFGGGGASSNW